MLKYYLSMSRVSAATDVFFAIADPTRRGIIDALRLGEQPVSNLVSSFDMSFSAVSQHVRILLDVGLVSVRRAGRERIYRLEPAAMSPVSDWVRRHEPFWREKMSTLGELLENDNEEV
jgi:DNA-binding transcriptional ArsR family regulator